MRNQYGSRHTIASDTSDIGAFHTPSNVSYVLPGPYAFNVPQSAADYYLRIPAEVVRDSLLVDVKINRGDRPANGTGATIAVCTDEPNPVCSPSGMLFEIQPGEAGNNAAYDRKDIKVSLGQYVPRTQSVKLKLTCILDGGNGSCEWNNFRFYEDLRPWVPIFSAPTTNRTFSSTASTFDGITPRQSGHSFAAIRVKGDNNETRYRSSLVVLPQFDSTDVLTASVFWSRAAGAGTMGVGLQFVSVTGGAPYEFITIPANTATSGWTPQFNNHPGWTSNPTLLSEPLSGKIGWLDIVIGAGGTTNFTLGLDSLEFFLNGKPVGLHAIPADQIAGECPCKVGANVQHESAGGINTATGSFSHQATDLALSTSGPPLTFSRSYVSLLSNLNRYSDTVLGAGWRHSFAHRLTLPRNSPQATFDSEYDMVIYEAPSGNRLRFVKQGDTYTPLPGVYASLIASLTGYTLILRDQSVLTFALDGRILTLRDPQEHTLSFSYYDANSGVDSKQLNWVADEANQRITFKYGFDQSGWRVRLMSITDSTGRNITFGYSDRGNLNNVSNLRGGTTEYDYLNEQIAGIRSVSGTQSIQRLTNTFTWWGELTGQTLADGSTLSYSFSSSPEGRATTVTRQKGGQQTSYIDHYRPDGSLEWQEQAGQFRTYTTLDGTSLAPTTRVNGAGQATRTASNAVGLPTSTFSPSGLNTQLTYSPNDQRLTQVDGPDSVSTNLVYDADRKLIQVNQTGQTDSSLQRHTTYTWTSSSVAARHNRLEDIIGDDGIITRYSYNILGQVESITQGPPPLAYNQTDLQKTSFGYDLVGRVVTTTVGLGTPLQRSDVVRYNPDGSVAARIQNHRGDGTYDPFYPDRNISTSYGYDAFGRQIWQRDVLGRYAWLHRYDNAGRLVWEVRNPRDASGVPALPSTPPAYSPARPDANITTFYGYDLLGRTAFVTQTGLLTGTLNPVTLQWSTTAQRVTRYEYDELSRPITVTLNFRADQPADLLPDVNVITASRYDGAGNLTWQRDALGRWTRYEYNTDGSPTATIVNYENGDPATISYTNGYWPSPSDTDITTVTQYDSSGRVWKSIQNKADGLFDAARPDIDRITLYTYDSLSRVRTAVENFEFLANKPDLNRTSTTLYDPVTGQVQAQQDPLGNWTVTQYDSMGRPWQTVENCRNASNQPTSQDCAASDAAGGATDRNIRTQTRYDALGRAFETVDPLGYVTRTFYDGLGRVTGNSQNYRPDLPGDGQTNVASLTDYDALGRVVRRTDAGGNTTLLGYNGLDQTTVITDPLGRASQFGYDGTGAQRWSRGPDGLLTVLRVDGLGRVIETILNYQDGVATSGEPTDQDVITRVRYDAGGNTVRTTSPSGRVTAFTYDNLDRLIAVQENATSVCTTPPCGVSTYYDYDRNGNRTGITDARGNRRSFSYDAADQMTVQITAANTASQHQTRWDYDVGGRLTRQYDPRGGDDDLLYSYDGMSRLTQLRAANGAHLDQINQSYNARGERLSLLDGTGSTSFTYDALGRMTQVTAPATGSVSYSYNALGQRTGISYPGGPNLVYAYHPDGQLDYVAQNILPLAYYSYDSAGRLQQISRENGATTEISYTAIGQVRELHTSAAFNEISRFSYTFDRDGNTSAFTETLQMGGAGSLSTRSISYGYDGLGRLTSADASSGNDYAYTYDTTGNRTGVWVNGTRTVNESYDAADQVIGWQYDAAGNLLSDGSTSLSYDALGRVQSSSTGGQTSTFTYNGDSVLVYQTDSAGATTRYTQDLAAPLPQILQTRSGGSTTSYLYGLGRIAAQESIGPRTWYVADTLGSVRQTLNDSATPLTGVTYDPWGKVESGSASTFGFTGELQDSASGLLYLRARWYNPASSTFTSRDPFEGTPERPYSLHPYAYGLSNPLRYSDPTGRFFKEEGGSGITSWEDFANTYNLDPATVEEKANVGGITLQDAVKYAESYKIYKLAPQFYTRATNVGAQAGSFSEYFLNHDLLAGVSPAEQIELEELQTEAANGPICPEKQERLRILLAVVAIALGGSDHFTQVHPFHDSAVVTGGAGARRAPPPAESFPHDTELGSDGSQSRAKNSRGPFNARSASSEESTLNCSECVVNFETSARSGYRVRKQIDGGGQPVDIETHMKRLKDVGANPKIIGIYRNEIAVRTRLQSYPPGTRFSIVGDRGPKVDGHVFAGHIDSNHTIHFFEVQEYKPVYWSAYKRIWVIIHNP